MFYRLIDKFLNSLLGFLINRERYGAFRFKLIRMIYRLIPNYPDRRNKTWDFVLNYLPPLFYTHYRGLRVLDIGCTGTLLIYEIAKRGYNVCGLDLEDYQVPLPKKIKFIKADIGKDLPVHPLLLNKFFHYIVAIGTIELIGMGIYGDELNENGDRDALENIYKLLDDGGYFILVLPIESFRNKNGRGYTFGDVLNLINGLFNIFEMTQVSGNICVVLVKILYNEETKEQFILQTNNKRLGGK